MHRKDSRATRWIARSVLAALILTMPGFDIYKAAAATIETSKIQLTAPQIAPIAPMVNTGAGLAALPVAVIPQAALSAELPPAEAQAAATAVSPMQAAVSAATLPSLRQQDAAPAQISAEGGAMFDKTPRANPAALSLDGADNPGGGSSNPGGKDEHFIGEVRSVRRPGEMIDAVDTMSIGKKLGMSTDETWKAVGRLAGQGRLATFSNGSSMVVDLPPADPDEQPAVEGRALAMKAVALLNAPSTVDHMRAVALLRRAYMKYPQGDEDAAAVESRRQITYLRMNASLEVVRDILGDSVVANKDAGPTQKAMIAEAKRYFDSVYYDSRRVPIAPTGTISEVAADAVSNYKFDRSAADVKDIEYGWAAAKLMAQKPAPAGITAPAAAKLESGEPETRTPRLLPAPKNSVQGDAPARAPVIALNGVFFPGAHKSVNLGIEGKDGIAAMTKAANNGGYMIAATFAEGAGTKEKHHPAATLVRLSNLKMEGDKMTAQMEILRQAAITDYEKDKEGTLFAKVSYPKTAVGDRERMEGLAQTARDILGQFGEIHDGIKPYAINRAVSETRPEILANTLPQDLPFSMKVKQALLSASSLEERLEGAVMELMSLVRSSWKPAGKGGDGNGSADEEKALETVEDLTARMDAIGMPEDVRKVTMKEFKKLLEMNPKDADAQKTKAYIDWLIEVPWAKRTEDHYDLKSARTILDRDHSGMDTVKERVLEFLAVRKKTGSKKGTIICFSGPPGVGKTSIAAGIAEAIGRKFVRLSLGGVHDETELRGHGRTYLGSLPGSVIKQMKVAGTINPVMLLDEVDKIGRDGNHGDPTAALLEILDPAQNNTFRDHYLEVPYDLSQVIFIVTANELGNIPAPLRDRMEIIEFSGYTPQEKIAIAQQHVLPEKSKANGLEPGQVQLTEGAIRKVIEGYTREAGVRGLREKIESLLRKISAWSETRGEPIPATVDAKDVPKYLGIERFSLRETAENEVGLATGLAVNDFGGSTLNVEVLAVPGNGQLRIRKQMMKMTDDSALNVYAYIKSKAKELGIAQETFARNDIEIAFTPAGDIDGPSAGVTMATAMASRLTGRKVLPGVAMTGEITLTGRVLPIGGLKQKVMAAHRMGYKLVLFPQANLKDLEGIPQEVRDGIKLVAVKSIDEVFALALEPAVPSAAVSAPSASGFVWWKPWTWFSGKKGK